MELYIFDTEYETVGVIDEADSVLWNKKYNDSGYCEIYTQCDDTMLEMLQKGYYVYRYDDDMFCRIDSVEIKTNTEQGDYIVATANDICNVLSGRIIAQQIVFSGNVANFIKKVLTENVISPTDSGRAITNFIIDESNFALFANDKIDASVASDDLLRLIVATCKAYNIGFRVSYNISTSKLVFSLYKGTDRSAADADEYVEFSPTYSNIVSSNYKTDSANYKNVAYVGYKTVNDESMLLAVTYGGTMPTGESRREIYVDGTSTSRDITYSELLLLFPSVQRNPSSGGTSGYYYVTTGVTQTQVATFEMTGEGENEEEKITVTDYTYMLLIRTLGINALAEHSVTESFSGEVDTIDTYEYKTDYNIGDIVKVENEYGISAAARITEIMESDDTDNGYVVEPKFDYGN